MAEDAVAFRFACPRCHIPLERAAREQLRCSADGLLFPRVAGIWRFLLPERAEHFARFIREYETVREGEGRGSDDSAYYQTLPLRDLTGRFSADWRIRAASYRAFLRGIVVPREGGVPLRIFDLGAGNGWLSYRLAQRGHHLAAIDLQTNRRDGLGAHAHYDAPFVPVQAEFDRLPFASDQGDVLVFNASLHYSEDVLVSLREALRVVREGGAVVIMDSPLYRDARSGRQMVREREAQFRRRFGFPSDALASENFLTESRLAALAAGLGVRWRRIMPWPGLRWAVRPLMARLRGKREPAHFPVLVAERTRARALRLGAAS